MAKEVKLIAAAVWLIVQATLFFTHSMGGSVGLLVLEFLHVVLVQLLLMSYSFSMQV